MYRCFLFLLMLSFSVICNAQDDNKIGVAGDTPQSPVGTVALGTSKRKVVTPPVATVGDNNGDASVSADGATSNAPGRKDATSPLVIGDVNGDKVVTAVDVVDIVKYTKGSKRSTFNVSQADINSDGKVDLVDAEALSIYITGGVIPTVTNPDTPMSGSSVTNPSVGN